MKSERGGRKVAARIRIGSGLVDSGGGSVGRSRDGREWSGGE